MLAYIDPSEGFVFAQNAAWIWGTIIGIVGSGLFLLKVFFKSPKRRFYIFAVIITLGIIGGSAMFNRKQGNTKKVIILGIDAMDPRLAEQFMREGVLPTFARLKNTGTYAHLATTVPPESAVAWTSFATGLNPGEHGISDFIMRDPRTYALYLSLNEFRPGEQTVKIRRKGVPFWKALSAARVPCSLYFCPNTFPPEPVSGTMLSGMGTPDILGLMGKFSYYTTRPVTAQEQRDSRGRLIQVTPEPGGIDAFLYGPKIVRNNRQKEARIPFTITVENSGGRIKLKLPDKQCYLSKGEWSPWQSVCFKLGWFKRMHGMVRFYLKAVSPDIELYAGPINFDPGKPFFPISYPRDFSRQVAKETGLYHTQGMPHDTWGLSENRLDEKAFLEQVDTILNEKEKILDYALGRFEKGVLFFYFDTLDAVQHMFWRYQDPEHPLYESNSAYRGVIRRYYERFDRIVARLRERIGDDTLLIIISDHGFTSYRKSVNLNRWLLERGYLALKEGISGSGEFFEGVDWSRTKAYALGFGGIYINRINREYYGIVPESEIETLTKKLAGELESLKDHVTGKQVVSRVYLQKDGPEIFVGFNPGYRASWQTALGGTPSSVFEDNKKKWSGDHLVDPALVPGVLFINKKAELKNSALIDIAPTLLGLFRIQKPKEMSGRVLFSDEE